MVVHPLQLSSCAEKEANPGRRTTARAHARGRGMDDSCGRGCGVDDDDAATSTVTVTTSFDVRKGVDRSAATVTFEDDARDVRVCVRQNRDGDIEVDPTARWVWDCAPKTCEHLCARAEELVRGKRVVEIGAGTGLPG